MAEGLGLDDLKALFNPNDDSVILSFHRAGMATAA